MSATLDAAVPTSIAAASVAVSPFAPGINSYFLSTSATQNAVTQSLTRFSVDNSAANQATVISTAPASGNANLTDSGIAVFDKDGNRIAFVDADPAAGESVETLSLVLQANQPYELGVYGLKYGTTGSTVDGINISVNTGPEQIAGTVTTPAGTGPGSLLASGSTGFNSSSSVEYYPIQFTDGGPSGTVAITAGGPDTNVTANLYVQTAAGGPYSLAASGTGTPSLNVTAPAGTDLVDENYVLAVSPASFTASPEAFTITASSTTAVAPASVASMTSNYTLAPAISTPGSLTLTQYGLYITSAGTINTLTAPVSGPLTLTYTAPQLVPPALAVYAPGGSALIGAATSQTDGATVSFTFNASAGTTYEVLTAADATQSTSGIYSLTYQQSYTPTPLTATTAVATQATLNIAPSAGAQFFRITPPAGANYLSLQLSPDAGSTVTGQITIVSASGAPTTYNASAAGSVINVPVNLAVYSGAVDVEVTSTGGNGTASFRYASFTAAQSIPLDTYQTLPLNVSTGSLTGSTLTLGSFGAAAGIQYYALVSSAPTNATYTAPNTAGSDILLLHYSQVGSTLQLQGSTANNTVYTSLVQSVVGGQVQAVVAVSLNPTGSQNAAISVFQPTAPVGVGMAPNATPGSNAPSGGFGSDLTISNASLAGNDQRDFWQTILPSNLNGSTATLNFTPTDLGGSLVARVSVLNTAGGVLATATSTAGGSLPIPLNGLTSGETLQFLVEPVSGAGGQNGGYSLTMHAATTNPLPFLVSEQVFYPYSASHQNTVDYLPSSLTVQTLALNGSAAGSFTSSLPYYQGGNSGSIAVYSLTVPSGPFDIYTTDDSGITPVNTNIALYQPVYTGSTITSYTPVPGSAPDFDYYPADRTLVDAEININNPSEISTSQIFVVVKNEQGSLGSYHIHAATLSPATLGPGNNDSSTYGQTQGIFTLNANSSSVSGTVIANDLYALNTPFNLVNTLGIHPYYPTITVSFGASYNGQPATLLLYTAIGATPTSSTVTISGGNAVFAQSLNPSSVYYFRIQASASGQFGATVGYLTQSQGSVPASNDTLLAGSTGGIGNFGAPTEPYTHADPSPTGNYSSSLITFGSKTGTLIKDVFWNPSPGQVTLAVSLPAGGTNLTVGLYQVTYSVQSGFGEQANGVLVTYSNAVGPDGNYDFNAFLSPGAYYIKATGSVPSGTNFATIAGQTPAYVAQQLTVDPNSGSDAEPIENTIDSSYLLPANPFQTVFYEVNVPTNVGTGHTAFNISGAGGYDYFANVTAWAASGSPITTVQSTGDLFNNVGISKSVIHNPSPYTSSGGITTSDMPVAGEQYFFGIDRSGTTYPLTLSVTFPVYQSGTPDLAVSPIVLTGQDGETHVTVTVTNNGYAQAGASNGLFTFSNYATTASVSIPTIGALGSWTYTAYWVPAAPSNTAAFLADSKNQLAELSKANNLQTVALSTVDASLPTETIALSDPLMTSEGSAAPGPGGGTWGRYVSGVTGQTANVIVAATAGAPINSVSLAATHYSFNTSGASSLTLTGAVDFGLLPASSASNSDQFMFDTTDIFGLTTGPHYQNVDVAPKSGFLTTETFSTATHQFTLGWVDDIINQSETLDQLLNASLPIVGDDNNQFLINLSASGTATLNPATAISLPLTGHILIEALNSSLYDKTFNGSDQPTKNLSIHTTLAISGKTLTPTAAAISLQLTNLNLLNYTSPKITLFSYGIADIASLDADFYYGIKANLNAGVKVGLNPAFLTDPLNAPFDLGLMSPTYVQPSITATAYIDGQVSVFGIDLADLTGSLGLTLTLTLGLDNNNLSTLVPLSQVPGDLTYAVNATLNLGLSAHVAILGQIWSYNYPINLGNIVDTTKEGIITSDPADGGSLVTVNGLVGAVRGAIAAGLASPAGSPTATVNTASGSTLVGTVPVDPRPQIAINDAGAAAGSSPFAIAAQVTNVGTASAPVGNIEVSTRTNGTWSGQSVLSETNDVATPSLALTHDAAGTVPAVLTYVADNVAGAPAGQTINQRADASDIRYRYFNGATWSAEQSVTNDNLYDSDPTVSFNNTGSGVLAYIHNTDPAPLGSTGFDANADDIAASVWNAATHTWSAPVAVTGNDGFDDTKPATFVDSNGKQYIVWIRNGSNGDETNQLMYSVYSGSSWSAAAVLPITGLTAGGSFGDVTVGSDASGRIDVIFSYRTLNADGSENSVLYNRPTTLAGFTAAASLAQISQNENYSYLQTTTSPTGSLVVSWEQSDGVDNQVFAADVTNSGGTDSAFTTPVQLTDNPDVTVAPSVAVDSSGKMQILYDHDLEPGQTTAGTSIDPAVGVTLASGVSSSSLQMLPQFSFQNGLYFNAGSAAPTGTQTTGSAVIVNRGLVSAPVTINAYLGQPGTGTLVGSSTITLGPGSTYSVSQLFTVAAGTNTYSIQLTTPGSQAVDTTENLSTATITGQADLAMISVTPSVTSPLPGQSFNLIADIRNLSTTAIGTFTVSLSSGDPRFPQIAPVLLSTQNVSSVGGGQDVFVSFPITLPDAAGNYVYTVKADSNNVISESNEADNDGQYSIEFLGDPAVTSVVPTLVNYSGSSNVQVVATVINNGQFPLSNLPVDLVATVQNGSGTTSLDSQSATVSSLAPGASTTVTFTTDGYSGTDFYQVLIDPTAEAYDGNLANNSITSSLSIQALPTLNVVGIGSTLAAPHQNDPLQIYASVYNSGIADAYNVLVQLQATPTGGGATLVLGSTTIPDSPPMNSSSVNFNVNTSALLGSYTFSIVADPDQQVLQTTEANDSESLTLTIGAALPQLNLSGSNFYLKLDADGTHLDVYANNTGTGSPTQYVESNVGAINITGSAGNDSLTIDITNGNPIPLDQLNYTGGTAAGGLGNVLNVIDHGSADILTVQPGQVQVDPVIGAGTTGLINETNIQYVRLTPAASSELIVQAGASAHIAAANTGSVSNRDFSYIFLRAGAYLGVEPAANTASRSLIETQYLQMDPTAKLDLSNNDMDIQGGTTLSQVQGLLTTGYNLAGGGNWSGPGIVSSSATRTTTLGYLLNDSPSNSVYYGSSSPLGLFDGYNPNASDVLIKYTYYGDANLSGKVDGSDYSLLDGGYKTGTSWVAGDFNYDGTVDGSDYALIDNAFNNQAAGLGNVAAEVAAQAVALNPAAVPASQPALSPAGPRAVRSAAKPLPTATFSTTRVGGSRSSQVDEDQLLLTATPAARPARPVFSSSPVAAAWVNGRSSTVHHRAVKPASGDGVFSAALVPEVG